MTKHHSTEVPVPASRAGPQDQETRLLTEYGDDLGEDHLSDDQKKEVLLALWQLMAAFVELGFSVKAGDRIDGKSDLGFDDVLELLIPIETAPETAAPTKHQSEKESR